MDINQPPQEIPIYNGESIQLSLQAVAPEPSSDHNLNDGSRGRGTTIMVFNLLPPISGMSIAPTSPSSQTSSMSKTFPPLSSPPVKSPVLLSPPPTPPSQAESPFSTINLKRKRKGSNDEAHAQAPSKRICMHEVDINSDFFKNLPEKDKKKYSKSISSKEGRDKVKNRMAQLERDIEILLQKNAELNLKLKLLEEECSKDKIQLSELKAENAQLKDKISDNLIDMIFPNVTLDDDDLAIFPTLLESL